jgi:hypothetical protein
MAEEVQLWGFERDLHELLDDFIVQVSNMEPPSSTPFCGQIM